MTTECGFGVFSQRPAAGSPASIGPLFAGEADPGLPSLANTLHISARSGIC